MQTPKVKKNQIFALTLVTCILSIGEVNQNNNTEICVFRQQGTICYGLVHWVPVFLVSYIT